MNPWKYIRDFLDPPRREHSIQGGTSNIHIETSLETPCLGMLGPGIEGTYTNLNYGRKYGRRKSY